MFGDPCWPLKNIMSAANAIPPGIIPLVCLWLVCKPIVNGGFNPNNGELRSQIKLSSITRADFRELIKLEVSGFGVAAA